MRAELYSDPQGFEILAGEWNTLLRRTSSDTVFLTWEWQKTWWEWLGAGELCLIAVRDEQGQLTAIAPLFVELVAGRRTVSFVGCEDVSDYLDLILGPDHLEDACRVILDALEGAGLGWEGMDLCNIPATSPTLRHFAEAARARGHGVRIERADVCPVIALPGSWEAYLASLPKKQRHEVRRKLRRAMNQAQARWYVVDESHDLQAEMNDFIRLHQKSAAEKDEFMDVEMQGFFHAVGRVLQAAGWLQLMFLELDGQKAAALLNFDYANSIMVYNSGFDPDLFAHLSPGIVLLAFSIQHAIDLGRARFDFLRGDEEYKYRMGGRDTEIFRLVVER